MPPRPPSNNQEVPNRIQSPMANQGKVPPVGYMLPQPSAELGLVWSCDVQVVVKATGVEIPAAVHGGEMPLED